MLSRLVTVLSLQRRVRTAARAEMLFAISNETAQAFPYRQAVVTKGRRVLAASGADRPEGGGPYVRWVGKAMTHLQGMAAATREPVPGVLDAVPDMLPEDLRSGWAEWMPVHAMVGDLGGGRGMLVARDAPFQSWEREAFSALCGSYGQSLEIAFRRSVKNRLPAIRSSLLWGCALACVAVLSVLPIRETVLAPSEAVPQSPAFVRAPHQGVVSRVLVSPNQPVQAGQALAEMDAAQTAAQAEVSARTLDAARAELLQAGQEALIDGRARARLPVLRARVEEAQADLDWQRTRLERSTFLSPADGVAVFEDASTLTGKPVETGERIMLVAPRTTRRIEIHLPLSDALLGRVGNEALFFPDADPLHPVRGVVSFAAHNATAQPDGSMAYTLRFEAQDADVRLGSRGTARVMGGERPFLLWVLRKPIAAVRQWIAF